MATEAKGLALITGASTGIGYELARCCAEAGYDLLVAIHEAGRRLQTLGVTVDAVEVDLSTLHGVDRFYRAVNGRPVDILCANAGRGLGHAFLDQDFVQAKHVVETNITGTIYLIHHVGNQMRRQGQGRILITGSIAGFMPGTYQAVYNGTKAFLDNFAFALRHELRDSGVTVTCLMPGETETDFFERAEMLDTKFAQQKKDDPADVARKGFEAMMRGEGDIVTGWVNKLKTAIALVTPNDVLAEIHRRKAEPGTGTAEAA